MPCQEFCGSKARENSGIFYLVVEVVARDPGSWVKAGMTSS